MLTEELPVVADVVPFAGRPLLRTSSVDEAQAGGARLLSQHRLKAPTHGFRAEINGVSLGGLALYYMRYGTPLTVTSPPMDDIVAITVPLRGSMRVEHGGTTFIAEAGRSAAVISPGMPMRLDWSKDLEFFCFRIDVATLNGFLRSLSSGIEPTPAVRLEPWMTARAGLSSILGCAWLIERASQRPRTSAAGEWLTALPARLSEQVMTTLLLAQPDAYWPEVAVSESVSHSAVARAREIVEDGPNPTQTPSELAAAVGVSLRTLQQGFRDELGTTPHAYLLEARLRRAHSELTCSSREHGATVAAIAGRWGFSNVGRFAEKYHARYGCKPAETLRRV